MATGTLNINSCHPAPASPWLNVAVASSVPVLLHRLPLCVPVLAPNWKNRIPVMKPAKSDRNRRPSSTGIESLSGPDGVAEEALQTLHGHIGSGGGADAPVVNDHVV